jgi:gliding motility-associated-like protein
MAMVNVINDSVHAMFGINILHDCDSNLVVDLLNQSINAVQYTWTFGDGTSSTQTNPGHTYTMPATYTIKLVAIDTTLCHPVDSLVRTVTLKPNTVLDFIAADVCRGTAIQFSNLGNPNAKFIWYFADGTISGQYSPSHLYPTPGSFDVKLTMIDTSTCNVYDTAQHTVQVYQQPVAGFLVQGDTFRFDKPVHFTNNSIYYDHLFWNFGDGDTIEDETNPTHTYENIGDMNVCIIASNSVCADTMCKNIFISFSALIGVPNAFSPNGDGVNDVVKVEGKGIVGLVFRIYNRWGEKVFETHDKNEGWNGIYKGILQEMDVYTYAVEATLINGQTVPLKGNITLLR